MGPEYMPKKFTKTEIKARFDEAAHTAYLNKVPKWFPDSRNIYRTITDFLNCTLPESPEILDVGAGTGNLTKLVLKKVPNCHVTLLDFSQNMLKKAEMALSKYKGRYEVNTGDFLKPDFRLRNMMR